MERHNAISQQLGNLLLKHKHVMTTAESCTGGGVATSITDTAGSSAWFDRAFITYSNEAKEQMVNVNHETLEQFGAVSEQVVKEMVMGALKNSSASIGVAISGIAGPTGGTKDKPVGTVCFAWADENEWLKIETCLFDGDRSSIRDKAIIHAIETVSDFLSRE